MKELKPDGPDDLSESNPGLFKRSRVLLFLAVALFGGLLIRILLLQTVEYDRYQQKVLEQMTTESEVVAERGNIYDVNGALLATNINTYRIFISPSSIADAQVEANKNGEDVQYSELISKKLSELLGVDYSYVLKQTTYTKYLDRTIKKEVDEASADRVRAFIDEYGLQRMVYLQTTETRYYPYSNMASHVIGFTGSDGSGLYGLEYQYNTMLSGTNGRYITARDAQGNEMPYSYKEYIAAEPGYHLNTTIDVYVQSALEEQVRNAYLESNGENRAAGIVMDVNTGAILGMATYPDFNLNDPTALDSQSLLKLASSGLEEGSESYSEYRQRLWLNMWSNKAITEAYTPGSTFKVITAAMALEESVVSKEETYTCAGSYDVLGHDIHCHKVHGHGTLTFVEGIQQSCNPWLMRVGLRIGGTRFYSYLRSFGYFERTGVDLPGEGVSVFQKESKLTDLDLAIYSFGQNFSVTLIQQITAISAVANGGYLVQPHLVSSVVDNDGNVIKSYDNTARRQIVSEAVCAEVSKILEGGVSGNGGAKNAYVAGYQVAAKTGTSEKKERECPRCDSTAELKTVDGVRQFVCSLCGYTGDSELFPVSSDYVCSTVAYAPADNPQYAVIIIVDEPHPSTGAAYGSTVAAPYVGNVMKTILPYLGVEAVYTEEELQKMTVKIPDYQHYLGRVAEDYASEYLGVSVEIVGDPEGIVYKQYPEAGTVVEKNSAKIILYTGKGAEVQNGIVPDVIGSSAVAANAAIVNAGFNIRILGTKNYLSGKGAVVVSQSVAAGTELPKGSVIEVTFRYLDDVDFTPLEND
ncbi:MAG: PASTA domain-containing protein [Clostridia bacterium]|nr:PASTA domain-containing protein [Clostridia bacterium]